ncbi:receptor protein Cf-9 [Trifolium repens]|nr:receptor protein Cf-9 [Trifolium repens]
MGWLLLFLHLLLFHFPSFSSSFNFLCHHYESSALLQFMSSFTPINTSPYPLYCNNGEDFHLKTATWKNGTDCCSWNGVTCDTISGHVVGLNLGCEGIRGTLHANSTLFHLTRLEKLNLSYIEIYGSHFHFKFGRFLSLTHLDLSDCNFKGEVPLQISHLSKLQSLHLSQNTMLVWKETTLKRLVQNATNLRELILEETDMSSVRPNYIDLLFNKSSSLVTLNLQQTKLSGKLKKSLFCLPNIQELDMSGNINLEVQLQELSCGTSLRILHLSNCLFKGSIPLSLSNFTHLTSLFISGNNFNGSIPSSLLTLPRLTSLYLDNNDLSGQIPNVFSQSNRFQELDLSMNKIEGELPTSLSTLHQLVRLDLSYNSFSGQIPDVFGEMTKLQELSIVDNKFEGQIPSSLYNLSQLKYLYCSYNKLEGPLPNKFSKFKKLIELSLNDNLLNGTIPPSLLSLPSLVLLNPSNNLLSGHISAVSLYSLRELYLNSNMLEGNIPESVFNLANLTKLILSSNNLSGLVDFKNFSNLQRLQSLSLSHNSQLSLNFESSVRVNYSYWWLSFLDLSSLSLTRFPKLLEKLPALTSLDMSNNKLNGEVPNWLLEKGLQFLNLSQNSLTSIDQMSGNNLPDGLDLSFNLLDGEVSLSICNKSSIVLLNLAHNKLTGTIPHCLANISSLEFLDLQMNNFLWHCAK